MSHTLSFLLLFVFGAAELHADGLDASGGSTTIKTEATGWFRIQKVQQRWFFITPEGHGYLPLGVNHLRSYFNGEGGRLRPVERDLVKAKHGGDAGAAAAHLEAMLRSWGFNYAGYDAPPSFRKRMPFSTGFIQTQTSAVHPGVKYVDVFAPEFATDLDQRVAAHCAPLRENKLLLGHYLADLPLWGDKAWMDAQESDKGESWLSFFRKLSPGSPGGMVYAQHRDNEEALIPVIADQIYRLTAAAFQKHDPHHLVLGERYAGNRLHLPVIEAAAKHFPVIAVQLDGPFDAALYEELHRRTGRPLISCDHVTAFPTAATPSVRGKPVKTEHEAAALYAAYLREAFAEPYMLGYNRCQLMTRIRTDGDPPAWKQGLLAPDGEPYPTLLKAVTETNRAVMQQVFMR